jgi:predicted glycosyltransferase involved in capsule biosynthesis
MATSTILCNKQHFLEIGAFDEEFVGHMGEDLELLNRLSIVYGKFPFEADHCENWPSKVAAELKGFRKHFINYSVPHLKQKLFTTHLHHNTHIGSKYKNKNEKNLNLLLNKLRSRPVRITSTNNHILPSYLNAAPVITLPKKEVFKKKLRKLLTNPKKFFKDTN